MKKQLMHGLFNSIRTGALALLFATFSVQAGSDTLDGQAFDVEMIPKGSGEPIANTLTFRSGTFLSAVCVKHDFPQSEYMVTEAEDGALRFEVAAQSYTKGHMDWDGKVVDGQLQASAVWHRPDRDEPIEFEIRGTRK